MKFLFIFAAGGTMQSEEIEEASSPVEAASCVSEMTFCDTRESASPKLKPSITTEEIK